MPRGRDACKKRRQAPQGAGRVRECKGGVGVGVLEGLTPCPLEFEVQVNTGSGALSVWRFSQEGGFAIKNCNCKGRRDQGVEAEH